ncbi:MAG: ATP-binding protein [Clostridiales Family XIII bacterium]|jgi:predicted AAA+ superfamily ATPase|nr:ATP-binding protein [Clostridiales Family XIII bacterium]
MIKRQLEERIRANLWKGKAILIMGARQVGKTTLVNALFAERSDALYLSGDEPDVRALFGDATSARFRAIIGARSVLILDEAQRIPDIGLKLKLITDQIQEVQLIATGSSSFDLANRVNEPLTGRKFEYALYPLSFAEMTAHHGLLEEWRLLPQRLIYGYYPDVVQNAGDERTILTQLADSYLYKDILSLENVKKSDKLITLLQALSLQLGAQVSYNELAGLCGLDAKTIERYIGLLESAYIIFRLRSFGRNLRNELKYSRKIYFYDNGIRNALTANFAPVELRGDIGALWENFLMAERLKYRRYRAHPANAWFWRTQQQQEIDYIEEYDGVLHAYEFKWNPNAKAKAPAAFLRAYPGSDYSVVHRDNFEDFVL